MMRAATEVPPLFFFPRDSSIWSLMNSTSLPKDSDLEKYKKICCVMPDEKKTNVWPSEVHNENPAKQKNVPIEVHNENRAKQKMSLLIIVTILG